MSLKYGYELDENAGDQLGHLVVPPLLKEKITLSGINNTNRWVFYGTRPEILEWFRQHTNIEFENTMFTGGQPETFKTDAELVIDLMYYKDPEQSTVQYLKSFVVTDYENERVKVEVRPRVDSRDQAIQTLCRVIVRSGVKAGDIVADLEREWYKPVPSFARQTMDLINDNPGPVTVLSADAPRSVSTS
ncbi:uncharacterized protein BYT42DRAFT_614760 [Radiomyces spectabilis]|uniref:uncharacterized protein n=1 Tax=Radiomyces spectabilis TaxID=64574 RepID=UPI00221EF02D|nr:uncharacterized protein BYT42DRAFT_614760 [Radiomyces spectabilis]KAI8375973.1 hypothetical protein BYT42DRAFT_614760 [Radiomyces spectabilis]